MKVFRELHRPLWVMLDYQIKREKRPRIFPRIYFCG